MTLLTLWRTTSRPTSPVITYTDAKGNANRYKGGRPFPKASILAATGLDAAIDDDMLNIDYKVVSFEMVFFDQMGNAIPEISSGNLRTRNLVVPTFMR